MPPFFQDLAEKNVTFFFTARSKKEVFSLHPILFGASACSIRTTQTQQATEMDL